jgi:hypothetical protein
MTLVEPTELAVTRPLLFTPATEGFSEDQVTEGFDTVLPDVSVPLTDKDAVWSRAVKERELGDIWRLARLDEDPEVETVTSDDPVTPPL